jgi:MoaA/NifB/PqqE/SkfB family radical SAM enzyme
MRGCATVPPNPKGLRAGVCYNDAVQGARNNMATGYKSDLVKIYHSLGREKRLGTVIFFVTSICNAKCRTCFYWEELNQRGDLTWDEIRKLAFSMPPFTDLWLSGGEPMLRRDLTDIIHLFHTHNGVRWVNLPTNGLLPERTAGDTSVVIDFNGDVRSCELRGKLANLRDYDCDFEKFWQAQKRQEELGAIVQDQCWCTHVCFIHDSLRHSPKVLLYDIPITYLESKFASPSTQGERFQSAPAVEAPALSAPAAK